MKIGSLFIQKLPSILISAVIGVLFAMIVGVSAFDIFSYELLRQLLVFALLWCGLGLFFYILLTRLPNRFRNLLTLKDSGLTMIIQKIFLAVFFLFPMAMILYQQLVEFLQIIRSGHSSDYIGWLPPLDSNRAFFILVFALSCILSLAVFSIGRRPAVQNFFNKLPDAGYVLFIFIYSLVMRLPIIYSIDTQPISDFGIINEDALSLALGGQPTHMYVATHVAVTMIYGFIYQVFGTDLNVIKIFHAAVYGLAGIFLFGAGKMIFESKLWAAVAAILLVGLPSLAAYSNVLTPEHLFIMLECALIFAAAYLFKNWEKTGPKTGDSPTRQFLVWSIVVGFLIGLMGLFRPFSELFLVAFVFTLLLYIRNLKAITVNLLFLLIAFWLIRTIPTIVATHFQNQFGNIRPCNLLVGMNIESSGQYNVEDQELCTELRSEIPDETRLTKEIMGIVWERFQKQQSDLVPFVNKKFAILWANSNGILFWTVQLVRGGDQNLAIETVRKVNLVDFAIMFLITIACVFGTVMAFFKDVKPVLFFCLLTFFGFNLMEIVFELQTRYRTVVMPILIFFACWTFVTIQASTNKNDRSIMSIRESGNESV